MGIIVEDTYFHFAFIDAGKAVGLLNRRTGAQFTEYELFKFAENRQVNVYVNCSHKKGKTFHWDGLPAKARGMSSLFFPSLYLEPPQEFPYQLALWGEVIIQPPDHPEQFVKECLWYAEVEELPYPQFKPSEIEKLASLLNDEVPVSAEKPLHPSERKSAGQIIATLSAMAGLDLSAPYAANEVLRAAAATHGLELPSSPETVVKFLKDAATRTGKA